MKPIVSSVFVASSLFALAFPSFAQDYVWWEGEAPTETNFPAESWFSASTFPDTKDQLSGGAWLSSSGKRSGPAARAAYGVTVPEAGSWHLWTRKFWKHGPFRWRFDGGEWRTCDRDCALADSTALKTHVCANWVSLGEVDLPAGLRRFELELLAAEGEESTGAFDCFVLVRGPFQPRGKSRPDERPSAADPGTFAFAPALDSFGESAIDLSRLNEEKAGRKGRVRREGNGFGLGDGTPVRFWAVNVGPEVAGQDHASIDYLARRLAKLGVNMVRFHGALFDERGRIDPARLERLHYLVHALKARGIYTLLSSYFPLWVDSARLGVPEGYAAIENKIPFFAVYFDPAFRDLHRGWLETILGTPNPYEKVPLGEDPALAVVELVNEDSLFFWTFQKKNAPPAVWERLLGLYGKWLAARHGSVGKALAAWGGAGHADDDADRGLAGLFDAWHMTSDALGRSSPGQVRRIGDQVRFLAELQRGSYEDAIRSLRSAGYRGLVSCSNWQTADARLLDALERWTYTAGDVIDRHGYFGGRHDGDGASYSVRAGHTFRDRSGLLEPEAIPVQAVQVEGHPQIVSEIGWPNPNRYRAEATFLGAAYGALQGLDGIYWFSLGSAFVADSGMEKFAAADPVTAYSFPALALLYRRGDLREADPAVVEVLDPEDLFAMKGSAAVSPAALDELRRRDVPGGVVPGVVSAIDPRAAFVGPVFRRFRGRAAQGRLADLSRQVDPDAKTIRSLTGEIEWDYGLGLVRVEASRVEGAAGFFGKAGRVELGRVSIELANEYAAVAVVSLDGESLGRSKRILVQVVTPAAPNGFRTSGSEERRIEALGGSPFNVERVEGTVTISNLDLRGPVRVTALDENGYPVAKAVSVEGNGSSRPLAIRLAPDALYHLVER